MFGDQNNKHEKMVKRRVKIYIVIESIHDKILMGVINRKLWTFTNYELVTTSFYSNQNHSMENIIHIYLSWCYSIRFSCSIRIFFGNASIYSRIYKSFWLEDQIYIYIIGITITDCMCIPQI